MFWSTTKLILPVSKVAAMVSVRALQAKVAKSNTSKDKSTFLFMRPPYATMTTMAAAIKMAVTKTEQAKNGGMILAFGSLFLFSKNSMSALIAERIARPNRKYIMTGAPFDK